MELVPLDTARIDVDKGTILQFCGYRESFLREKWGCGVQWCGESEQSAKVFSLESFLLYGMVCKCVVTVDMGCEEVCPQGLIPMVIMSNTFWICSGMSKLLIN